MAKGSAMGLWRGKKGSTVFYRIANSNSLQKQGMRERNYEPANPQTNAQAGQRLKMLAAQRVYGALKPIISRAFQGVKYGQMSRQAYLKYALAMEDGYPYLSKEQSKIVPGTYLIARGSLSDTNTTTEDDIAQTDISATTAITTATTVGALSTEILSLNSWLMEGDQLTFVVCYLDRNAVTPQEIRDSQYIWRFNSFYLNPNDTTPLSDIGFNLDGITSINLAVSQNGLQFSVKNQAATSPLAASAYILSRLDEGTGGYLRSNARLSIADFVSDAWMSAAQQDIARKSYQSKAPTLNTDWPVEDSEEFDSSKIMVTVKLYDTNNGEVIEGGATWGYVSGGGSVTIGEATTVIYTPGTSDLWKFYGWAKNDPSAAVMSTEAEYTFIPEGNMVLYARVGEEDRP